MIGPRTQVNDFCSRTIIHTRHIKIFICRFFSHIQRISISRCSVQYVKNNWTKKWVTWQVHLHSVVSLISKKLSINGQNYHVLHMIVIHGNRSFIKSCATYSVCDMKCFFQRFWLRSHHGYNTSYKYHMINLILHSSRRA